MEEWSGDNQRVPRIQPNEMSNPNVLSLDTFGSSVYFQARFVITHFWCIASHQDFVYISNEEGVVLSGMCLRLPLAIQIPVHTIRISSNHAFYITYI